MCIRDRRNTSRGLTDLALVEFGSVFEPASEGHELGTASVPPLAEKPGKETLAELNASIPRQPRYVAGLLLGDATLKQPGQAAREYDWACLLYTSRCV